MTGKKIQRIVILFFLLLVVSFILGIIPVFFPHQDTLASLFRYIAFIFVIVHSIETLGPKKTSLFFTISILTGFTAEYLGVTYGLVFGKFAYHSFSNMILGAVPWQTPLSWAVIIYTCYSMTNLLLKGFDNEKPSRSSPLLYSLGLLLLLPIVDAIAAMNIDMILDPMCVNNPNPSWTWATQGQYFGIPISNFVGWFVVVLFVTVIFRTYEYGTNHTIQKTSIQYLSFMPVMVYATYTIRYVLASLASNQLDYSLIGIATMTPFLLMSLLVFIKYLSNIKNTK